MEKKKNNQQTLNTIIFITIALAMATTISTNTLGITGTNIVSEITEFIVDTTSPYITSATNITPEPAYTNSTLNCTILTYDATTNITANITWYVNGTAVANETNIAILDNIVHENFTYLSNTNFTKWNIVSCNITLIDDAGNINKSSEAIFIENYPPQILNLSYPEYNDEFFTNRTPMFNWTNATDIDNDKITYTIEIDTNNDFTDGVYHKQTNITEPKYWYNETELELGITYYWRIQANDSDNVSDWAGPWNFTLVSYVSLVMINSSVDFGLLNLGETKNTENSDPYPFKVENNGNVDSNVNISALPLWSSENSPLNTSYFMYKANLSYEANSFDWDNSQTEWQNMSDTPRTLFERLNHTNNRDLATVDIAIETPMDEIPGTKNATVTLIATET